MSGASGVVLDLVAVRVALCLDGCRVGDVSGLLIPCSAAVCLGVGGRVVVLEVRGEWEEGAVCSRVKLRGECERCARGGRVLGGRML